MHKILLFSVSSFISLLLSISASSQSIKFEAEQGILSGTLSIATAYSGYSGTGYVAKFDNETDKVSININLEVADYYNLYVGYAAPFGEKINIVSVNGNRAAVTFPSFGNNFSESSLSKVKLRAGDNDISILKSWGWFLVDYIRIEKTDPPLNFNIATSLVTPNASAETRSLYMYLLDNFNKKIHSGVMNLEEAEWLKTNTGKYPALIGLDFMNHNRDYSWYDKSLIINEASDWYSNNGLVALCWHWRDPLKTTDAFYTTDTDFDITKVTDSNSPEYKAMINDIDIIAGYLKQLQAAKIPVLFRPLHEAWGGWFWWGAKGPEPCKVLWKLLFERLVNYHGIDNLIWVWTTDTSPGNMDWYPGDQYVDILGMDIYTSNQDFSSQVLSFNKIKEDFKGKKLITLSENGVIPDADNLVADGAGWSWFMTWYGGFTRDENINPLSHWQELFNHDYVLTRDEMPDLANYPNSVVYNNSPTVGAIRWDGWVGGKGTWQIGPIVERTLGPERFHYRAPFFSVVIAKDSIIIDGTTQEIMDQEIAYAKNAGIDYWAYCWYPDGCGLETARKLHQTSSHANDVKWCVVLGPFESNVSNNYGTALVTDFTRPNYQKVLGGRPLVYLYDSDFTRAGLDKLRKMTTDKNLMTPYVVVMAWSASAASDYCTEIGADAISSYAELGNSNRPFNEVIPPQSVVKWESYSLKKPVVPWVGTGWNARPRMDSPNPWIEYYSDASNCQDASPFDLKEFFLSAIDWTTNNPGKAPANTIILYAWNEHDEGFGAICPTLGADGSPNTERLLAVKEALASRTKDSCKIRTFQLKIVLKDLETNAPVTNILLYANDSAQYSDSRGTIVYNNFFNPFFLKIDNEHYFPLEKKQYSISSDTTILLYLTRKGFSVTFTLMDNKTFEKFWGVNVSLGSLNLVTDSNGSVVFFVDSGSYEYTINKISYKIENGSLSIDSDTSIVFYLEQLSASAKFRLNDGSAPLNDAVVKLNSDSLLTNSIGIALFKQLPLNVLYSYSIAKTGYNSASGEFYLTKDTVIYLTIELNTLDAGTLKKNNVIKVWPNPANEYLYCAFPSGNVHTAVVIRNLIGSIVYSEIVNEHELEISLKDIPSGAYIIKIHSQDDYYSKLFIKY
jgi:mannan endo-1,4-beta-mannosidase